MRLAALGSGSRGNGVLVEHDHTCLLVDCGFSLRATEQRLAQLGRSGADLTGILVTHEHGDHSRGVRALAEKYSVPVYLTRGTARHRNLEALGRPCLIDTRQAFLVGGIAVRAVSVAHDAAEPCQYLFEAAGQRVGVLTDLGHAGDDVVAAYAGCDALLLEANYDEQMLAAGPYPPVLRHRVGGQRGHLSNTQCRQLLERLVPERLQQLVLGHISEKNNTLASVAAALPQARLQHCRVTYAQQGQVLDWLEVQQ